MVRRLKHTLYKQKVKEFGLFSMEKRPCREDVCYKITKAGKDFQD